MKLMGLVSKLGNKCSEVMVQAMGLVSKLGNKCAEVMAKVVGLVSKLDVRRGNGEGNGFGKQA